MSAQSYKGVCKASNITYSKHTQSQFDLSYVMVWHNFLDGLSIVRTFLFNEYSYVVFIKNGFIYYIEAAYVLEEVFSGNDS
jgi:hypothetical protein